MTLAGIALYLPVVTGAALGSGVAYIVKAIPLSSTNYLKSNTLLNRGARPLTKLVRCACQKGAVSATPYVMPRAAREPLSLTRSIFHG